ncbi:hypothetical protein OAO87_00565 [bacterium]|nr:hypothetical protein [bacterium]
MERRSCPLESRSEMQGGGGAAAVPVRRHRARAPARPAPARLQRRPGAPPAPGGARMPRSAARSHPGHSCEPARGAVGASGRARGRSLAALACLAVGAAAARSPAGRLVGRWVGLASSEAGSPRRYPSVDWPPARR